MMTASYNTPASEWTNGIDRALSDWGKEIYGNANLKIRVDYDAIPQSLASNFSLNFVNAGKLADGRNVVIPSAAARFQGYDGAGDDMLLTINRNRPWSFGSPQPGAYFFDDVAKHELGHGLMAANSPYSDAVTPFNLWAEKLPQSSLAFGGVHFSDPDALMHSSVGMNERQNFSNTDRQAMRGSGIPTYGDDTFYLINGAKLDGGPGNNRAYWLDSFDNYNANLSNISQLIMGGQNPLNQRQQDVYRLYKAGFNRAPDLGGFRYWNNSGKDMMQMANDFYHSPEFAPTASLPDTRSYIAGLYQNILNRDPDPGGLDYWSNRTDLNRSGLLANIALAPENMVGTPSFTL